MHQIAKLSSKHQATVPAAVRRALGLRPGDRLAFDISTETELPVVTLRNRRPVLMKLSARPAAS